MSEPASAKRRKPNKITIGGKDYLTFPDGFAKEVAKSGRTVRRWENSRVGPPVIVLGKSKLVDPDDIPAWLASRKREPLHARTPYRPQRRARP